MVGNHLVGALVVEGVETRAFVDYNLVEADVVFHQAALIAISYSYQAPLAYLRTNIEDTLNVFQGVLTVGTEHV